MQSFAECPLRNFCCIITTSQYPFHILHIDNLALDFVLNIDSSLENETLTSSEINSLSELRTVAQKNLIGTTIDKVLSLSLHKYQILSPVSLQDDNHTCTLQTYKVLGDLVHRESKHRILYNVLTSKRAPRLLHGCIHTSNNLPQSKLLSTSSSSSSLKLTTLSPLIQNISSQCHVYKHNDQFRVYALKDITDIHNLAMAVKYSLHYQQRRSRFPHPSRAPRSIIATRHPKSSAVSYSVMKDVPYTSVTSQKPYSVESAHDWSVTDSYKQTSSSTPFLSSLYPLITSHYDHTTNTISEDMGLLLLQITAFGTIDHAFVTNQYPDQDHVNNTEIHPIGSLFTINDELIRAMSNRSVMYYTHPDDIRTLCRGLGQISNSESSTFCIRWSLNESHIDEAHDTCSKVEEEEKEEGLIQPNYSREIEYKGEVYEEWIDPTAATPEPSSPITKKQSRESEYTEKQSNYIWTEVKALRSSGGQPILVIRPLTAKEIQEQSDTQILQEGAIANSQTPHRSTRHTRNQHSREWKHRAKKMGLEEGKVPPRRMSLSALTSIDEPNFRMPGSFPYNNLTLPLQQHQVQTTQTSLSTAICYSRPTTGMINMPSVLAYPQTRNQPWSVFANVALDAWKQWIQVVRAGQAQFQDWCEYVLETTIDQLIESVSIGLTLLDIENGPIGPQLESEKKMTTIATKMSRNTGGHLRQLSMGAKENRSISSKDQQKQKLTGGMRRVGQILHNYPNVEGAVRTFGNSWLGQKIKSRLEHKILDMAADQVVEWWFNGDAGQTSVSSPGNIPGSVEEMSVVASA